MKKSILISTFALASALTFVGCNKEIAPEPAKDSVVRFTINASAPETKTFIEYDANAKTYTPNWHNGDQLAVFFDSWAKDDVVALTLSNTAANGPTASFEGEGTVSSSEQTIYAFYPAGKFAQAYNDHVLGITIPEVQKPSATSFDKDADILVNKPYPITISSTKVVIDDMQFTRVLSTLKLVVADGTGESILSSDQIKSITLTTDDSNASLTGRFQWDFANESGSMNNSVKSSHVTADLSAYPVALDGASPIYFLVNPATLASGSNLTINISTDKHEITKTASLPKAFVFPAGNVANLSISIKDTDTIDAAIVEPTTPGWHLVQSASWLKAGDKIIITNTTPNKALGAQNSTYRNSVTVTTNGGLLNPGSATELELVAGSTTGTFALKAGSKYLAHVDTKNQLVEADAVTDISSWNIVVTSSATSIQNSKNTGYYIMWNSNASQERFACYTGTQQAINIYKQYSMVDTRADSGLAWDATEGLGDIKNQELALPTLANPNGLTVSYSSSDPTVATVAADAHTITLLKTGETQIHAMFAGNEEYKDADVYYTLTVDDTRTDVTLSFVDPSYPLTIGTDDYNDFIGQDVTASPSVTGVKYAMTGAIVGTIDEDSGEVTLDGSTTGTATITASYEGDATHKPAESASYTIVVSPAAGNTNVTDILDNAFIGVSGTSYTVWTNKEGTSGAIYAGNSAGGNSAIQLRTTNNNSGIVTTTSGGKVKKVTVTWNTNSASGRTISIYGKNSAYAEAADLYNSSKQGTLLGSIAYGTSTSITVTGDYPFIGIRSASGALYLDEIQIEWEPASGEQGGSGSDVTKGSAWTSGNFTATNDIAAAIDGVTITSSIDPTGCETASPARGLAWSSGKSPVITLSGYTGGIETVTVVMSTNGGSTSVNVAAGGTTLDSQSVTSGTDAANTKYTFTFSSLKTGDITINVKNTSSKSVWIKSISIN